MQKKIFSSQQISTNAFNILLHQQEEMMTDINDQFVRYSRVEVFVLPEAAT